MDMCQIMLVLGLLQRMKHKEVLFKVWTSSCRGRFSSNSSNEMPESYCKRWITPPLLARQARPKMAVI